MDQGSAVPAVVGGIGVAENIPTDSVRVGHVGQSFVICRTIHLEVGQKLLFATHDVGIATSVIIVFPHC